MNARKKEIVDELKNILTGNSFAVYQYSGKVDVNDLEKIRRDMYVKNCSIYVVKNTLLSLSIETYKGFESLSLKRNNFLVIGQDFFQCASLKNEYFILKGLVINNTVNGEEESKLIAKYESENDLKLKLIYMLKLPALRFTNTIRQLYKKIEVQV